VARGEEKVGSDVDLVIIGDISLREISRHLSGTAALIGREINLHIFTEEDFSEGSKSEEHFISRLIDEPKLFIIGNENDLEAMV
jgi:predicted nucleotidyltransferase